MDEEQITTSQKVVCGVCGGAVQGPKDPKPDDLFSCANSDCGNSDTYENVISECQQYYTDEAARALQAAAKGAEMRGRFVSITAKLAPIPERAYRFKVVEV